MNDEKFCPFAKSIWGQCCQCDNADPVDQRTRRVKCKKASDYLSSCLELDSLFKDMAYNLKDEEIGETLTYSQLMRVRCGGFNGLRRQLNIEGAVISNHLVIDALRTAYSEISSFPFSEILDDMLAFRLSKRRKREK